MAPSKKGKTKAVSKPAASTRATRAKSKEAAAAPAPIAPTRRSTRAASKEAQQSLSQSQPSANASAGAPPSRRSTRATSNEPLLHVNEPDRILRKARKTPELQVTTAPPTPIIEDTQEDEVPAPVSPSPVVVETYEKEEEEIVPSTPSPVVEPEQHQNTSPSSPSQLIESYEKDVIAIPSSPTPSTQPRASLSPSSPSVAEDVEHNGSRYSPSPEVLEAVYPSIQEEKSEPLQAIASPVTPTSCVHIEPSQVDNLSKSGGFFSRFTSMITTPVTKVTGFFGGAKTQPVQKTAPAELFKEPMTPKLPFFTTTTTTSTTVQLQTTPQTLFADILPDANASQAEDTQMKEAATPFLGRITITPRRKADLGDPTSSAARSTLYGPDGEKIPQEYRYWTVGRCQRQATDMSTLRMLEEEVDQGVRVLTLRERKFKEETLRRQYYYELWRARQPGNRAKAVQVAGLKRTTEDTFEDETPKKRTRGELTPVGYNCPTPNEPNYHHIHEEATSTPTSKLFSNSGSVANAPGFKPTARTGNSTFAVPEDDDDDVDMGSETMDLISSTPARPVNPTPAKASTQNWVGIPDWVYDSDSSDDEDEDMSTVTSIVQATPTKASALEAASAEFCETPAAAPSAMAQSTPFIHKYTPAKPSGLRAVETVSSSPAILTPPHSPTDDILASAHIKQAVEAADALLKSDIAREFPGVNPAFQTQPTVQVPDVDLFTPDVQATIDLAIENMTWEEENPIPKHIIEMTKDIDFTEWAEHWATKYWTSMGYPPEV